MQTLEQLHVRKRWIESAMCSASPREKIQHVQALREVTRDIEWWHRMKDHVLRCYETYARD